MKKLFLAIAAVAMVFATSCNKENTNAPEEPAVAADNEFVCVIDQNASQQNAPAVNDDMGTLAHIDASNNVWWQEGDQIAYYGTENTQGVGRYVLTCSKMSDNRAYFSAEGKHFGQGTHEAYYPASIMQMSDNQKVLTLPSTITLDANKNAAQLPMYGEGTGTHYLTFHNLCAVLKIVVPSWVKSADKIEISNTSMALNGTFTVNSNFKAVMSKTTGLTAADKKLTVNGTFTPGKVVYVPVPEGTLSNFSIRFYSGSSEIFSNHAQSATFQANKMYPITLKDYVCFTAKANNSKINFSRVNNITAASLKYLTVKSGVVSSWNTYTAGGGYTTSTNIELPAAGDKVYFIANSTSNTLGTSDQYYHYFYVTGGSFDVRGDLMYLLSNNLSMTAVPNYGFYRLFMDVPNLYNADLRISASSLGTYCCDLMLGQLAAYNSNLLSAKIDIAATTVSDGCFENMFRAAYNLTSVTFLTPNLTDLSGARLNCWLWNAGINSSSRTLNIDPKITTLNSGMGYNIKSGTSNRWSIYSNGTYLGYGTADY